MAGNGIKDEIRDQHKLLENMTTGQKISYIFYYYKIHIGVALLVLAFVISIIHSIFGRRDIALFAAYINAGGNEVSAPDPMAEYPILDESGKTLLKTLSLNPKKNEVIFDTEIIFHGDSESVNDNFSYNSMARIMSLLSTNDMDVMVGDTTVIDYYMSMSVFENMAEILPKDLYLRLLENDRIYFAENELGLNTACAVKVTGNKILSEVYPKDYEVYYAIPFSSERKDNALAYLMLLLDSEETK